jgi:hypothetical protein
MAAPSQVRSKKSSDEDILDNALLAFIGTLLSSQRTHAHPHPTPKCQTIGASFHHTALCFKLCPRLVSKVLPGPRGTVRTLLRSGECRASLVDSVSGVKPGPNSSTPPSQTRKRFSTLPSPPGLFRPFRPVVLATWRKLLTHVARVKSAGQTWFSRSSAPTGVDHRGSGGAILGETRFSGSSEGGARG